MYNGYNLTHKSKYWSPRPLNPSKKKLTSSNMLESFICHIVQYIHAFLGTGGKRNIINTLMNLIHHKKRFASFPSPAGMSLPNSPWAGIMTS